MTAVMLYVCEDPWQTEVAPEMVPGCESAVVTVTGKVCGELVAQALLEVTEMVPPVAPAVAVIDVEVELPVQPEGRDHA